MVEEGGEGGRGLREVKQGEGRLEAVIYLPYRPLTHLTSPQRFLHALTDPLTQQGQGSMHTHTLFTHHHHHHHQLLSPLSSLAAPESSATLTPYRTEAFPNVFLASSIYSLSYWFNYCFILFFKIRLRFYSSHLVNSLIFGCCLILCTVFVFLILCL